MRKLLLILLASICLSAQALPRGASAATASSSAAKRPMTFEDMWFNEWEFKGKP